MTPRPRALLIGFELLACAASPAAPTDPVVAWMKRTAYPLATCEPVDDQRDLAFLKTLVGDAHIVALGEGTHGTHEFFTLKHRITRYLATEMGFKVFAIEANMPEAYRVNDYVLGGAGDTQALLDGMYFWTWNTREVAALIEWMRAYNASKRGRMEFTGFDMQTPDTAAAIARRGLAAVDPAAGDSVDACLQQLHAVRSGAARSFATATSSLPPADLAGHHVRYSGWIRTEDVSAQGFAGLWMRADSAQRTAVAFDNMQSQGLRGTRDWKRYVIELDIPRGVTNINFGMLMAGTGQAWFDSLRIDVDGRPWTGDGSIDLVLEHADGPKGFGAYGGTSYVLAMDDMVFHDGLRSLGMRSVGSPATPAPAPSRSPVAATRRLLERVTSRRSALAAATSPAAAEWTIQNVRILEQCARMLASEEGYAVRDSSMADNVDWILAHEPPGTKIVLWAHNGHVSRRESWMGWHLANRHGADMVTLGFATYSGQYRAIAKGGLRADNVLAVPESDGLERRCHATGMPRFILDLRRSGSDAAAKEFLGTPRQMRSIGAMAMPPEQQFYDADIDRLYDAIVYVDSTTASRATR